MVGCDTATWEKHLRHHYRRYQEKKAKAEADVAESQQQLLKLLLAEAKQKARDASRGKDGRRAHMGQQAQTAAPTPPAPTPPPVAPVEWGGSALSFCISIPLPGEPREEKRWIWGAGRPPPPNSQGCFTCGAHNHWHRECPYAWPALGGWMGQASGRGYPAPGGGRGQPRHQQQAPRQAPNQGAAPPGRDLLEDWGPSQGEQGQY